MVLRSEFASKCSTSFCGLTSIKLHCARGCKKGIHFCKPKVPRGRNLGTRSRCRRSLWVRLLHFWRNSRMSGYLNKHDQTTIDTKWKNPTYLNLHWNHSSQFYGLSHLCTMYYTTRCLNNIFGLAKPNKLRHFVFRSTLSSEYEVPNCTLFVQLFKKLAKNI
jgi:hypothetical protein